MAKGNKDKKGRSTLDAAFEVYESGDKVTARRLARQVLAAPSPEDESAAPRLGPQLVLSTQGLTAGQVASTVAFGQLGFFVARMLGRKAPVITELPDEADAKAVATALIARTKPPLRPYLWALGGATAYALLLVLAVVRYG